MTVVVCIDDKNGMLFNHRRQSRDKYLIDDLIEMSDGKKIHIHHFSEELFEGYGEEVEKDDNFLDNADDKDICFVEHIDLSPYADKIDKVIVYHWNRHYPSSLKFQLDLSEYHLVESVDFAGSSHEKITREVYIK